MRTILLVTIAMLVGWGLILPASAQGEHTGIRIFLAGDSTVCNYKQEAPQRGWGQELGPFLAVRLTS